MQNKNYTIYLRSMQIVKIIYSPKLCVDNLLNQYIIYIIFRLM